MIVLVPAYEPDQRLVALVHRLHQEAPELKVLVVDDGSGPAYSQVFHAARAAGAVVVHHDVNRGKGRALKTGFRYAAELWPHEDLVCADCDGQHTPEDILRVADKVAESRTAMVLGARQFTGPVPSRSRVGNSITRRLFFLTTGISLSDTQTGLRAYPAEMLDWLCGVDGDRFEYELELLLRARSAGHQIVEVPIATVYLDGNSSSHFRPLQDSVRVYAPMIRFAASSATAAIVDYVLLFLLHALTGSLVASIVGARVASASVNYATNRRFVFGRDSANRQGSPLRYAGLVLAILLANWALMHAFVVAGGWSLLVGKVVTEAVLFFVSYAVQHRFVFGRRAAVVADAAAEGTPSRAVALQEQTAGGSPSSGQ